MPHGDWKLIVTDVSGNEMGELIDATGVRLNYTLNRPVTLSFTLRQDDPQIGYIVEGKSRVKAYRNGVLKAYNVVWDCVDEFSVDGSTVQVSTASPMHLLAKRFAATRYSFTNVGPPSVIKTLIDGQNAIYSTNIVTGAVPAIGATSLNVEKHKNIFDAIIELASGYDWLDWEIIPEDLAAVNGVFPMGTLAVYGGQGIDNLNVFFEFGVGKDNLLSVNIENRMDKLSTDVTVLGKAEGETQYASVSPSTEYAAPRDAYKALYQTLEAFGDITTQTFLDSLRVNFHDARKVPQEIVSFVPNPQGGLYHPFDDYNVGDRVSFRLDEGRKTIDGSVRIYGFTIELGETGSERVTEIRTVQDAA